FGVQGCIPHLHNPESLVARNRTHRLCVIDRNRAGCLRSENVRQCESAVVGTRVSVDSAALQLARFQSGLSSENSLSRENTRQRRVAGEKIIDPYCKSELRA